MKRPAPLLLLLVACAHATPRGDDATTLTLGTQPFTLGQLRAQVPVQTVSGFDPYYQREKRFLALPLEPVLRLGFPGVELARQDFLLRASDGYTVPVSGGKLLEGAFLAFADADGPWQPIGPRQADPAPWYLVWSDHTDLLTHPRPWALTRIEAASFEDVFPLLVPASTDARVREGFALFRDHCVKCHSLNQQGGRVGPELNVPQNVTEYRDDAFLRAWIRDPQQFRVSVMPPSPGLNDAQLDALLAYLRAMKSQKVLPGSGG